MRFLLFIPLFLIQPVFGESEACRKARAEFEKAWAAFEKPNADYWKAIQDLDNHRFAYNKALDAYYKAGVVFKNAADYAADDKALDDREKARAALDKANAARNKSWDDYKKVRVAIGKVQPAVQKARKPFAIYCGEQEVLRWLNQQP